MGMYANTLKVAPLALALGLGSPSYAQQGPRYAALEGNPPCVFLYKRADPRRTSPEVIKTIDTLAEQVRNEPPQRRCQYIKMDYEKWPVDPNAFFEWYVRNADNPLISDNSIAGPNGSKVKGGTAKDQLAEAVGSVIEFGKIMRMAMGRRSDASNGSNTAPDYNHLTSKGVKTYLGDPSYGDLTRALGAKFKQGPPYTAVGKVNFRDAEPGEIKKSMN